MTQSSAAPWPRAEGRAPGVGRGKAREPQREGMAIRAGKARQSAAGRCQGVLLFGGDADGAACGEAQVTHGLAVGDGDGVEAQVQLGGQVEGHALGPL
jgi:hypothetical protein